MRIHLIAPPAVQTTRAYSLDGFCIATIRFARILRQLGHTVFLYASEENEAPCDELVTVITKRQQKEILADTPYQYAGQDNKIEVWNTANRNTIVEIRRRMQARDIICCIGGVAQKSIADAFPNLIFLEYSIGYIASFARFRVFQSDVWRHWTYGHEGHCSGRFFDEVIPYFFDSSEYPFVDKKLPYLIYVGRLTPLKGISVACQVAKAAGISLKVIGHGDPKLVTDGAEYLGALPDDERNEVVSKASAMICPTLYLEPFGAMAVEAQFCGTPVISTDFGAFRETVEEGRTGMRCHYIGDFVRACKFTPKLVNAEYIRERACKLYSLEAAAVKYRRYFDRLEMLWDKGWETV